ncbi:hypothetical protein BSZ35_13350 [Salinibacter sp. 10B]|uniref:helix-turn-helix domain-containing protein n=1 Tax=Salinibacter sp. 10B TaxID=1923971 RepID=UPI000CF3D902|nr:AraC family transcriptional regulator [Salinibacter sp. 10B]PQJ35458.1 hypothetical protein BSZ35_13350 [Salinibacter sp. 10B]
MSSSSSQTVRNERVERVTSYIEKNIGEIETAREVATVVDVSYETLRKQFRRQKKIPLGKFIRQVRIDEARWLLLETDEPVYVICWKVGFSSDSNGIRAFKRHTGMTMGEYRRQYKKED